MKPTGKKYDIESFEQLINTISSDNFDRITMDMLLWLGYCVHMFEQYRKHFPKETKGKTNWEIAQCHFIWTDDGKAGGKNVVVKNNLTGEVSTFELKNK